jgi:predicted  nucleic acid-binding Zn-ribbon protein
VKEVIYALVALQEIDNEVYKYVLQKDQLANTLNEMRDLVSRMEQSVAEKQAKLLDVERWYNEQQDMLKEYNDRMSRIKASLNAVTKTKEYLVRQKELENLRRHKQAKEEEVAKVKDTINDFGDAIERDLQKITELKQDTEREGGATWDQVHRLEETIGEISKRRESLIPKVPGNILRRYEQIKSRRDGLAIVEARDGNCHGCFVALRPQQFNQTLKLETLESCPQCNRFLYAREETVEDAGSSDAESA